MDRAVTTVQIDKSGSSTPIYGRAFPASSLTLFADLEPGTYWINHCKARDGTGFFARVISFPTRSPSNCDVEAGRPTYFGQLIIREEIPMSDDDPWSSEFSYEWDNAVALEISAWEKILDSYPDSPWAPLITKRINSLTPRNDRNHE
jgi:hypothetical protein